MFLQEKPNIEDVACGLELPHSSANGENHNCFWHFFVCPFINRLTKIGKRKQMNKTTLMLKLEKLYFDW